LVLEDRLGLYAGAFAVAMMPAQAIQVLSESVVFPVFSNFARGKRDAMAGRVARVRRPILLAGMLCSLGVFLLSEPFFTLLYDARYHASGPMARLLAIALWVTILLASSERALLALGDSLSMAISNLIAFVCLLAAGWYGFQLADIHGFILGLAGSFLVKLLFVYWRLASHGIRLLNQDVRFSVVVVGLAGLGVGLARFSSLYLVTIPHAWCQVAGALIVLVPFGLYVAHRLRTELVVTRC
jgi:O-antigen/teichoic acid export membrane protein